MNYINNLGEFDSLADVWKEYPHGGKEGDYVVVNGKQIAWNKYTSNWGEDTQMPGVNDEVNGDFFVSGDLRVGGDVINKDLQWIKDATVLNKGYFKTVDDLKRSYPAATAGSKAYVGSDYPYAIYLWDGKNAAWVDSGEYFDDSLRNKGYFATVEALQAAYPIAVSGSKAYVGVTYPFAIYLWDAATSAWMDSGETGGEEIVNLGDYYTKEETDTKVAELESAERYNNLVSLSFDNKPLIIVPELKGVYYSQGKPYSNQEYASTNLIKCVPGRYELVSEGSITVDKVGFYDADKNFVKNFGYDGLGNTRIAFDIPSNVAYVRFTTASDVVTIYPTTALQDSVGLVREHNIFRYDEKIAYKAISATGSIFNASQGYYLVKLHLAQGRYWIVSPGAQTQTMMWKYTDSTYAIADRQILGQSYEPISRVLDIEEGYYAFGWYTDVDINGIATITQAHIVGSLVDKIQDAINSTIEGNNAIDYSKVERNKAISSTGNIFNASQEYYLLKLYLQEGYYWIVSPGSGTQTTLWRFADLTYSTGAEQIIGNKSNDFSEVVFLESGYYAFGWNSAGTIGKYNALLSKVSALGRLLQNKVEIILPKTIYAVVGDTLQLFYNGIIKAVMPEPYDILVTCNRGKQYPRYYEYTPTASDVGETTFTISVKDNNGNILNSQSCKLVTNAKAKSPNVQKNIVCFGDSLTRYGNWCKELQRRLSGNGGSPAADGLSRVNLVGRMKEDNTGWFGVGGWSWVSYVTNQIGYKFYVSGVTTIHVGDYYTNNGHLYRIVEVNITQGTGYISGFAADGGAPQASGILTFSEGSSDGDRQVSFSASELDPSNPFYDNTNNKISFIPYADTYANGKIDVVVSLLSWNGLQIGATDFSTTLNYARQLIDVFHAEFPQGKWKLCGIQLPSLNGGTGANYGAAGANTYADRYALVRTIHNMNKAFKEFAELPEYSDFVEFVCISAEFDSLYNMPSMQKDVNTRNASVKETIGTNGVHPNLSGYYQIADTLYRNLINYLSM